jgi:hypothetical protein
VPAGHIQREFRQVGHRPGDQRQRRLLVAVQPDQPLQYQLAHDPKGGARIVAARAQGLVRLRHGRPARRAGRQQPEFGGVAAAQALRKARMRRQRRRACAVFPGRMGARMGAIARRGGGLAH